MTSIVDLPTEILLKIIVYLDETSIYRLHTACDRIRHIIRENVVLKKCNLSLGKISTAQTLQSAFFKDISRNIQELNLRGVKDLNKTLLMSAANRLNSLKSLDVSYTNINMLDFIEIYRKRRSIKNITINLKFTTTVWIPDDTVIQCQKVFKNIESVHFIGNSLNVIYSQLPVCILNQAKLKTLQYTVSDYAAATVYHIHEWDDFLYFDEFIFNGNNRDCSVTTYPTWTELNFFKELKLEDYEAIFIYKVKDTSEISFAVTTIFSEFSKEHFSCYKSYCTPDILAILGHIKKSCFSFMLWRRNSIQTDSNFFKRVFVKIKSIIPWRFESKSSVSLEHSWFSTSLTQNNQVVSSDSPGTHELINRQRKAPPYFVINYDEEFDKHQRVELSIHFNGSIKSGVSLSADCSYLRKLTSLFLCGTVRFSKDFFNILFKCCTQLVTFSIQGINSSSIAKTFSLSQTLKNVSIVDRHINFFLLFTNMCQCRTLEVVNVCDMSDESILPDPTLMLLNCKKLYCLAVNGCTVGPIENLKLLKRDFKGSKVKHLKRLYDINCYKPCLDIFKCL